MKRTLRHIPSQPGPHNFQPININDSTSSSSAHVSRDLRDEPPPLISPSEAIDKLLTADLARGQFATDTLDPSTLATTLSSITPKPVTWLWPDRIPRGTLTLLDGDPGIGTSLVALTLAAAVSSGTSFAAQPEQTPLPQGHVLLLSPHTDPASTLAPRLTAAGADLAHVHFLTTLPMNPFPEFQSAKYTTRPFILPRDLSVLEALIQHHHASLLILDHLSALMPPVPLSLLAHPKLPYTDARAADSPDLFTALAHVASATDCAILLVRHTTRGRPLPERYGTAPVQLLLLPDPRASDQRLLCTAKNTLSAPTSNQTYQIIPAEQGTPLLHWLASNLAPTPALHQAAYSSLSPNRQAILRTLTLASGPLGPQDIATQTGLSYDLARRLLARMADAKEIARYAYGSYTSLGHPCLASRPPLPKISLSNPASHTCGLSVAPAVPPSRVTPVIPLNPSMPSLALGVPSPSDGCVPSFAEEKLSPADSVSSVPNPAGQPPTSVDVGRGQCSPRSPSSYHAHQRPIRPPCDHLGERSPSSADDKVSPTVSVTPVPLDSVSQPHSPAILPAPDTFEQPIPPRPSDSLFTPDPLASPGPSSQPLPSTPPELTVSIDPNPPSVPPPNRVSITTTSLPYTFSDPPEPLSSPTNPCGPTG